jgi:dTDP-4-amino-4,6-dideoxygalactose transaminase
MVIDALSRHDIVCQKPIKSILNKIGNKISKFSDLTPCAELALKGTLSLPAHLKMTNQQIESVSAKVIETLHSLL